MQSDAQPIFLVYSQKISIAPRSLDLHYRYERSLDLPLCHSRVRNEVAQNGLGMRLEHLRPNILSQQRHHLGTDILIVITSASRHDLELPRMRATSRDARLLLPS